MGTLDTVFHLVSLSVEISTARKVEEIRGHFADETKLELYLNNLRNEIFMYGEAVKDVLATESEDPKLAAAALGLLQEHLARTGLTPELFPEIADKQYMADVTRNLRENDARLNRNLNQTEQQEVEDVISNGARLPEYLFYLTARPKVLAYRKALPKAKRARQASLGKLGATLYWVLAGFFFLVGLFSSDIIVLMWGMAAFVAIIALIMKRQATSLYEVRRILETIPEEVDVEYYAHLEADLGTDVSKVEQLRDNAQVALRGFFGVSDALPWVK